MKSNLRNFVKKINLKEPFTYVDVGAMGGIQQKWNVLGDSLNVVAFEPDDREFKKLQSGDRIKYLNCIVYDKQKQVQFYVTRSSGKSSTFKPNIKILNDFPDRQRFDVVEERTIPEDKVKTLDLIVEEGLVGDMDFIKLDTQGSELLILKGAQNYALPKIFGLSVEVEFYEMYENQPLFRDVDKFLDGFGFQLIDLRRAFWKRKDFYDYFGKGQIIFGDALYFKKIDVLTRELSLESDQVSCTNKLYKCVMICMIYRAFDYAYALVEMGFNENYFTKEEYQKLVDEVESESKAGEIPRFPGRNFIYKVLNKFCELLKPESYKGWADGDRYIGNIKDF